jgi:hypothetical protein
MRVRMDKVELLQLCDLMRQAEIESCDWLLAGSNQVFIIKMVIGDRELKSVYKPRKGEAPLWDFPDGTLYKREYAAFLVSLEIGWNFIPPTIIRKGPYGAGSMQYMVEIPKGKGDVDNIIVDVLELKKIILFDYLVNNADRKISHLLVDRDEKLWIVDHGLTFNSVAKLRTVFWDYAGQTIPKEIIADVKTLRNKLKQGGELREKLLQLLDKEEIRAFEIRINKILRAPVFPHPTSPWSVPFPWY